jgi:hypothetical protein
MHGANLTRVIGLVKGAAGFRGIHQSAVEPLCDAKRLKSGP